MGRWTGGGDDSRGGGGGSGTMDEAGNESKTDIRLRESRENDVIDSKYGFDRITDVRDEASGCRNGDPSRFSDLRR